jgi:hypothetical protein
MGTEIFAALGISLALTLVFELAFCLAFKVRGAHDLLLVAAVNVLTNPVVILAHALLTRGTALSEFAIVLPLELMAVLVEGACYKYSAKAIKRPFLLSLGANAFSYFCGLALALII